MEIYQKAIVLEPVTANEALFLYRNVPLPDLMILANELRYMWHPAKEVSWIIDRNVNITNACVSRCSFCNFHCVPDNGAEYITSEQQYDQKINELFTLGGNQLLLQGGMSPKLGLSFYTDLFSGLKKKYPTLKLHALGPPEIDFLAKKENLSHYQVLDKLVIAGLDSLPGAGAEILVDRVRSLISPAKCSALEWLQVMQTAHGMGLLTTATMMYGHVESIEERIEHLIKIRELQYQKKESEIGFIAFIAWPFQGENTRLKRNFPEIEIPSPFEHIKMLALARIVLCNIPNIQASWLTIGKSIAQLLLHSGANDMGSIMIEENVVSAAGANFKMGKDDMIKTIAGAGFSPRLRNQQYNFLT